MQFNVFVLIKYIFLISISLVAFACSMSNNANKKDNTIDTDLGYFEPFNLSNNFNHNNDNIINHNTQLKIRNLQAINIIYFPVDKYYILPDFFSILKIHSDFLRNNRTYQIKIEGHTDERGTPEYNIALGERRAYSVKLYLQSQGVLSDQMEIVSYGKEKPVCFGHTEESYAKNRRVVLSYD